MLYCPNFFWNVLQVWMTGKDVYLQMTWSWPDKTWNILCSYCLQWNTSQSKFRNHYFLFLFAFSILSQLFLIWGCTFILYRYITFIKSDSKDIYNVTKHLYLYFLLYLKLYSKNSGKKGSTKILNSTTALTLIIIRMITWASNASIY